MTEHASGATPDVRSDRTDSLLRYVIIALVAGILGLAALFGYTIWQSTRVEATATPAQRALVELRNFVKKNPNSAAARVRYGEALASAGVYRDATEQFKAAIKLDNKHTGAYLDLGLVAMETKDTANAERYFTKVVELTEGQTMENINQRRETALFHLGEIALDDKRYEDAAGFFKASLRIRKDASDTYYLLAQSLHGLEDDDAALEQLDAALAFDPNYAEAHYLYGIILLARNDKINSAVHLRKAADLAPEADLPRKALEKLGSGEDALKQAQAAYADKRLDEAVEAVLLARALEPSDVDAAILHAKILIAKGDKKGAKQVLTEAAKLDTSNKEIAQLQASLGK